jgi:hypothetical protein
MIAPYLELKPRDLEKIDFIFQFYGKKYIHKIYFDNQFKSFQLQLQLWVFQNNSTFTEISNELISNLWHYLFVKRFELINNKLIKKKFFLMNVFNVIFDVESEYEARYSLTFMIFAIERLEFRNPQINWSINYRATISHWLLRLTILMYFSS